jgi:hypothetical protein
MNKSAWIVGFALLCAIGVGGAVAQTTGSRAFALPSDVAKYREWASLQKQPHAVPRDLWARCSDPRPEEWEAARRKFGPHVRLSIWVYANPTAAGAFAPGATRAVPVGSIIAKEKLAGSADDVVEGVAFMIKHPRAAFPDTDGWEFRYFPSRGDDRGIQAACAACHRAAARDYVFGQYPR